MCKKWIRFGPRKSSILRYYFNGLIIFQQHCLWCFRTARYSNSLDKLYRIFSIEALDEEQFYSVEKLSVHEVKTEEKTRFIE